MSEVRKIEPNFKSSVRVRKLKVELNVLFLISFFRTQTCFETLTNFFSLKSTVEILFYYYIYSRHLFMFLSVGH